MHCVRIVRKHHEKQEKRFIVYDQLGNITRNRRKDALCTNSQETSREIGEKMHCVRLVGNITRNRKKDALCTNSQEISREIGEKMHCVLLVRIYHEKQEIRSIVYDQLGNITRNKRKDALHDAQDFMTGNDTMQANQML